ncbi:MAG: aminotransferase class I/II-fold pyridoxal phosphate-dependent enzyme [Ignavibacterium sp.]|nr:aminotransferase class I/II-fold pyridoxal phosphate-dependent enzyme [Ignavibacterium sp.]
MHHFDPSVEIQDYLVFGEYGDVNPSITDSSTYTFLNPNTMKELFDHEVEGCFLYSRHWNPTNKYLADALAKLEDAEAAIVTGSGMSAIACSVLQLCECGDEIISSRTIYGGTYAFFKNFLPRHSINVKFVNIQNLDDVKNAVTNKTKIIYTETISNPLLEIADLPKLGRIADDHNIKLMVDNTFSPIFITPLHLGAHIVIHSLTKFINGTSDCVAGCVCSSKEFIDQLMDINSGAAMLLGPVLDSHRAASILKNLHSLHIRVEKHSKNAQYLAESFEKLGLTVFYPGLKSHKGHTLVTELMNDGFGYGGMLAIDAGDAETADKLMAEMQFAKVGYLAVSLGYFKTLFSSPGHSTSSEIPEEERAAMGLSEGLVRISIGLDNNIEKTFFRIKKCLISVGLIKE